MKIKSYCIFSKIGLIVLKIISYFASASCTGYEMITIKSKENVIAFIKV